ncbi:hypothetical protein D6855_10365 [Butyrivibrio sp. CB08]|uniref:carboxylesterase family protein n=1 Tax=Butyrivibrio sp. CB08 TaxID=2364879 RepID=UPI000EA9659B|nr:prolyl oligopeptidase family serine peptidase [Butyrivibrio sp. CB08]RKM59298.1 hypothetical protein D6855_10365 [Butyrivibrio sp. CB08]
MSSLRSDLKWSSNFIKITAVIAITLLVATFLAGCGKGKVDPADVGVFKPIEVNGDISFTYQLYTPDAEEKVPIVIVFHGYGEDVNVPHCRIPDTLSAAENQAVRPCYVMMPQVESNIYLAASSRDALYQSLMDEADKLIKAGRVDGNRIYAMGNSFGGLGTTEFVEKFPDRVAAAIVMCPALTYDDNSTRNLGLIKDVPLWFAQATNDNVIPITVSRSAVSTLEAMGAKEVHLTEFSDEEMLSAGALVGYHQADFAVMADDTFLEWLFEKSR